MIMGKDKFLVFFLLNVFHDKTTGENILFDRLQGCVPFIVDYMNDEIVFSIISATDVSGFQEFMSDRI